MLIEKWKILDCFCAISGWFTQRFAQIADGLEDRAGHVRHWRWGTGDPAAGRGQSCAWAWNWSWPPPWRRTGPAWTGSGSATCSPPATTARGRSSPASWPGRTPGAAWLLRCSYRPAKTGTNNPSSLIIESLKRDCEDKCVKNTNKTHSTNQQINKSTNQQINKSTNR